MYNEGEGTGTMPGDPVRGKARPKFGQPLDQMEVLEYMHKGGGFIGFPANAQPYINQKHIDGPLLYMRSGEMHWLTPWERLLLWLGQTDARALEKKHRPHLSR